MADYNYGRKGAGSGSGNDDNYYRRGRYDERGYGEDDLKKGYSSYGTDEEYGRYGDNPYQRRYGDAGEGYSSNYSGSNNDRDFDFGLNRRGRENNYGQYGNMDYRDNRQNPSNLGVRSNYSYNPGGYGSNFGGEYGHFGGRAGYGDNGYRPGYGSPDDRQYSSYAGRYDREYEEAWKRDNRDWLDKAGDEVASWFGNKDAEHRRRVDRWQAQHRGRGPRGYKRSDSRIEEDVNDRLSDDSWVDATDIEVTVSEGEVVLSGTVSDRFAKRRAEDIAESVSGVMNVENRIRVSRGTAENPYRQ